MQLHMAAIRNLNAPMFKQLGPDTGYDAVNDERIAQNFAATKIQLDADDMAQMGTLNKNMRLAKGAFAVMENGPYTLESIWEK